MKGARIVEVLLEGPDDFDPKAYIDRTLPDPEPPYYVVKRDENAWFNRGILVGGSEPTVVAVFRNKQKALNYAHNLGGKVYRCTDKSRSVRAWFKVGNKLNESDDIDPTEFIDQQFPDLPVRIEQVNARAWRIFDLNGHWLGDLFYDAQYLDDAPSAEAHQNWHDIHWFITPADVHKKQAAFKTKHEAIKYVLESADDPEDMVDRLVSGDVPIGRTLISYTDFVSERVGWRTADFRFARTLWNLGLIKGCPAQRTDDYSPGPYFGLSEEDQEKFHRYLEVAIPVRKAKNIHKADYLTQNTVTEDAWMRLQRDLFLQPDETSVYIELDRARFS